MRSQRLPQNRYMERASGSVFSCCMITAHSPSIDFHVSIPCDDVDACSRRNVTQHRRHLSVRVGARFRPVPHPHCGTALLWHCRRILPRPVPKHHLSPDLMNSSALKQARGLNDRVLGQPVQHPGGFRTERLFPCLPQGSSSLFFAGG